jgi:hypothetical protein
MFSTMSGDDEIPPLPQHAADLEAESVAGGQLRYSADEGIRVMTERIAALEAELRQVHEQFDGSEADASYIVDCHKRINPQLNEARRRLVQYQLQRDGKN